VLNGKNTNPTSIDESVRVLIERKPKKLLPLGIEPRIFSCHNNRTSETFSRSVIILEKIKSGTYALPFCYKSEQ
jgi:hypothetical protein